jgi:hypothetical protein
MQQIVVHIRDKEKAKVLLALLTALDFVDSVKTSEAEDVQIDAADNEESSDFFCWQAFGRIEK